MQVEPAVVKIDFDVTVEADWSPAVVFVNNIDSHGAKGLFFLNFDDEPPFLLNSPQEVDFGSNIGHPGTSFSIPGEYSVTGIIYCNKSQMICIYYNAMGLVTATDANQITSVSLTKTFRVEEPVVPELLYCDQVAR